MLQILISGAEGRVLPPAVEITQVRQVRDAYKYLSENKGISVAVEYLEEIVATKVGERQGGAESLESERLVRGIGTEITARLCLADAHHGSGRLSEAVEMLDEAEGILLDHGNKLPRGFLAIDWLELTRTAQKLGLPWATLRFLNEGLATDPDREDLRSIEGDIRTKVESEDAVSLIALAHQLSDVSLEDTDPTKQVIVLLKERLGLEPTHPYTKLLYTECMTLFNAVAMPDSDSGTIEELADRLAATARILLSEDAYRKVKNIINWILRHWGTESTRLPADVRIHDDTVWPRRDEREACCLLALTPSGGNEVKGLTVEDPSSGNVIFQGNINPDRPTWVRWLVEHEEGFSAGHFLDLRLNLSIRTALGRTVLPVTIPVTVAEREPRWPSPTTAALTPDIAVDLYGRSELLATIVRGLGPRRAQNTLFLEGPRQMGKTSILRFLEQRVPTHVFAVYINLEKTWAEQGLPNLWGYLIDQTVDAAGFREYHGRNHLDRICTTAEFVRIVNDICDKLAKNYILLLLDEFRTIIERSSNPGAILSEFRDFHDNPRNRISLLIADRLTRAELEKTCPHEL